MFNALENTPLEIDLVAQARSTGWSFDGDTLVHEVCNAGRFRLKNFPLTAGESYQFSFVIESISGGYVQPSMGDTAGTQYTTSGFKQATLVASGSSPFSMYSDADVRVRLLAVQPVIPVTGVKQRNTIVWSEEHNRWKSYYTYNPDMGFSMFSNLYTLKNGNLYLHLASSNDRNEFYGTTYPTSVKFTSAGDPEHIKYYQSIAIQANRLMITTVDGVQTSLGQVSELIEEDFLKDILDDGSVRVDVYDKEGVYSASFLRDKNIDLMNGDVLKGHYITVEITTVDEGILKLFTVAIHAEVSRIGVR